MPAEIQNNIVTYKGCNYLRYRLLLSTLSGKPLRVTNIRTKHDNPGLQEYEISFIRLLDKMTNGGKIELNETGTSLYYNPGLLNGGELEHECNLQRGIGYYLEGVIILAPFCKNPVNIKLKGIVNNTLDPSVDRIKTACIPILKRFIVDNDIELNIKKRGMAPFGGGEVHFRCPISRTLKAIQLQNSGMVKRIRGVSCSVRVSPAIGNRMVETAKGILLKFLPDIYIHTDNSKGAASGKSSGFGISLTAETTNEVFFNGESFSPCMTSNSLPCVPEDIAKDAAMKLLDEIYRNGCIDSPFQSMTAMFMALGKKDISKVVTGPLTQTTIQFLRDLRDFFGIVFKIEYVKEDDEIQDQVCLTCVGIGYTNLSRRTL